MGITKKDKRANVQWTNILLPLKHQYCLLTIRYIAVVNLAILRDKGTEYISSHWYIH